jgi:hypothetical protein
MRTHSSIRTIPYAALTGLLILTCAVFANAQVAQPAPATEINRNNYELRSNAAQRPGPATQIGTAIPQGRGFRVELNEEQLSGLYPQYAAQQANARQISPAAGKEEFRRYTLKEILSKLETLFPTGVPEGAARKIKISVTVKLSKPPEFGISVEW